MKWLIWIMALFGGAVAHADQSVTINGATYFLGFIPGHVDNPPRAILNTADLPLEYDAVAAGRATPVKDDGQGSCGDCWAWARTSSLEAAAIAAGAADATLKLSELDTTVNASDEYGCGGGMMDFNYEVQHGVTLQANCPFNGGHGRCTAAPVVKGVSMAYVGGSNGPTDAELMAAIYQYGSVAVTVAASGSFDVDSGTDRMTSCGARDIDHMVSLVGYRPGVSGGVEFRMKNSWGHGWGKGGYAYLKRGCNQIATGDESAMVISVGDGPPPPPPPPPPPSPPPPPPPPPPASRWQCEARPAIGVPVYLGQGATKLEAKADAVKNCRDHRHPVCYVDFCQQLSGGADAVHPGPIPDGKWQDVAAPCGGDVCVHDETN